MSSDTNGIRSLASLNQSIWVDNLSKELLDTGGLEEFISAGVVGLTSNPTIFKKAIADTDDYDSLIVEIANPEMSDEALAVELMSRDVARAADMLRPVFDESEGRDGFASLEVSPALAHDTAATISQAESLWERLARPNVKIKVPATQAGLPAIEELISKGINVNVTLIFSTQRYREVIDAYLKGLERRVAAGAPLAHVSSVASFFVSRLDVKFEKQRSSGGSAQTEDMVGEVAIANCRIAYQEHLATIESDRFRKLAEKGAQAQRPLWASTSPKNPGFPALIYVDRLVAPDTVNTLPESTLKTLREGVTPQPLSEYPLERAQKLLGRLEEASLSLDTMCAELEDEGVRSFADSYQDLLAAIGQKRKELVKR